MTNTAHKINRYAVAVSAMACAALALTGVANAAPTGPASVAETVKKLQADGFDVGLNKTGTAPMDQCTVSGVRPGQTFERVDSGAPGAGSSIVTTVTAKVVYVDAVC